jgi:hypothetical protein
MRHSSEALVGYHGMLNGLLAFRENNNVLYYRVPDPVNKRYFLIRRD